jgi:hypothetical protein
MPQGCRFRLNLITKYPTSGVICDPASFISIDPCCFCIRIDLRYLTAGVNFLTSHFVHRGLGLLLSTIIKEHFIM